MASPLALRALELKTHALLRVRDARDLRGEVRPAWVEESLERAPWVVVRRAVRRDGVAAAGMPGAAHGQRFAAAGVRGAAHGQRFAAVGVRGAVREQRFAAWVAVEDVLECVTPQELVRRKAWRSVVDRARVASIPALAVLDEVAGVLEAYGLGGVWGPGGSVGFELASGFVTATAASDLDLVIEIDRLESFAPGARALAKALVQLAEALGELPVRVDALLETPDGAVVLSEYAHACGNGGSFVLRTPEGPRLIRAAAAPLAAARL